MRSIPPPNLRIPDPKILPGLVSDDPPGVPLDRLLEQAGIPCRVTTPLMPRVQLVPGTAFGKGVGQDRCPVYRIGVDAPVFRDADPALRAYRIAEYLAYGAFDYVARESLSAFHRHRRLE